MALTKISASVIAANAIVAAGVAENSISTSEIATDGVGTLQISDGAVTSGKLETNIDIAGTLDVTGVLTADSNVVIAGNLTVNGATVTNSSTNTTIADALIELGTGTTGSPANDAGIVIERGDSDNAFIGWDESADTFILGTGSFTGASTGNLTISTAPLSVGTLTASGITYPTSDGSSGQILKTDGSGNLTFDANTAVVDNFTATGDGSTTDFDTGINPGDEVNTWVFIDGVYQQKGEYSYSGSTISFSTAPDSGATIDVTTGTVGGFASADSVLGVYETTTTNTDTYTTGISASNENNTWVFVGGVYQPKDSYTFSSGTLTFDANTPTGQKLSVTATKSLSAGSVETNSITANAVTSAKIASNSILSRHIANNSIVGADISATTQITASTFTGALTGDVTGNVVGNLTGTVQTAAQTNITSVGTLSALTVSGQLTAGGLSYPTSDGTNEQVLRTDGSGNLSFGTISGTTINNNTNNYVMTGTGTANTLNGESGLTYDGTTLQIQSGGNNRFTVNNSGASVESGSFYFNPGTGNLGNKYIFVNSGSTNDGGFLFSREDANRWQLAIDPNSDDDIGFYSYGTNSTVLKIDRSTGKVGIGTDNPGSYDGVLNLESSSAPIADFNSTSATGGFIKFQRSGTTKGYIGTPAAYMASGGVDDLGIRAQGNFTISTGGANERLRIDSAGVVYFGPNGSTADPRINRHSNGYDYINSGNSRWLKVGASSGHTNVAFQDGSSGITIFETAGTERIRITSDGKIGINESVPTGKLHVRDNNFAGYMGVFSQGGTGGANHGMYIDTASSSSYLMIQKVSGTTMHYVAGNGNYYFAGTAQSDLNKKENIADISSGLDVVNNLRPRTFNFKDNSTVDKAGFIAQEAQIVESRLVSGSEFDETQTDDEGSNPTGLGFDYMGYTAYLTKAIQEQQTIIDDLKSRIETLEE
jgi:hypothetical protein